jgi:copper chaperone CopZ
MTKKTVNVPGISCGHCVATIEREVGEIDGVDSVKAEQTSRDVTIAWNPDATDWIAIEALLNEIDYPPSA